MSGLIERSLAIPVRRFRAYPNYKDSGVEWLREIPAHWSVMPLKRLGELHGGAGFPDDEQGVQSEDIPFFKVGDMAADGNERVMMKCPNTVSDTTARRLRAFVFPPQTIVFAKVGAALLLNRRRLLERRSCLDNNMMGFIPEHCDAGWAMYWLSGLDLRELANPGAVPSINEGQMRDTPAIVPPIPEQRAIAAFLDRETAKLDALVVEKERLIELLQEKRTALITRAFTKGLDPGAPLKDSGVEWLGDIPVLWKIGRLKYMVPGITVGIVVTPARFYVDEGLPCLRAVNISSGRVSTENLVYISAEANELHKKSKVFEGDLVLVRTGRAGTAVIVPKWLNGANCVDLLIIRRSHQILPEFLRYYASSVAYSSQVEAFSVGALQAHYNTSTLGDLLVPVPPVSVQNRIVVYLDQQTRQIETISERVREGIDCLKEFRAALISAVVTGKIDVREEAA